MYVGKKIYVLILSGKIVYEYYYPSPKLIITIRHFKTASLFKSIFNWEMQEGVSGLAQDITNT